jgi:hypothetical protein
MLGGIPLRSASGTLRSSFPLRSILAVLAGTDPLLATPSRGDETLSGCCCPLGPILCERCLGREALSLNVIPRQPGDLAAGDEESTCPNSRKTPSHSQDTSPLLQMFCRVSYSFK